MSKHITRLLPKHHGFDSYLPVNRIKFIHFPTTVLCYDSCRIFHSKRIVFQLYKSDRVRIYVKTLQREFPIGGLRRLVDLLVQKRIQSTCKTASKPQPDQDDQYQVRRSDANLRDAHTFRRSFLLFFLRLFYVTWKKRQVCSKEKKHCLNITVKFQIVLD